MTKELDYKNVDIADGIWHHIALVWSDNPEEMTLYVDGTYKDQLVDVLPGATRYVLVHFILLKMH